MEIIKNRVLLRSVTPIIQICRFRGKINIQRPRAPHYDKVKLLFVTKPKFAEVEEDPIEKCIKQLQKTQTTVQENPYQRIIANEVRNWFNNSKMVAIFHSNPISSEETFQLEVGLRRVNMHLKAYGAKTLEMAFEGTGYHAILPLFASKNMIVFSPDVQVAKLLKIFRKYPQFHLLAGIVEGKLLSKDEITAYSKLPDLQTARAGIVQVLQSAGTQITQHLNHHQNTLVNHLQKHVEILQNPEKSTAVK